MTTLQCLALAATCLLLPAPAAAAPYDKPTYHQDAQRSGWNRHETRLTPATVGSKRFGQLWQSPQFDAVDGQAPRLFATPLYIDKVAIDAGKHRGTFPVVYAATDVGYLYAVSASSVGRTPPGTILWQRRLAERKPHNGNLGTPVIDTVRQRIYMVSGDGKAPFRMHALDLRSGAQIPGWPVAIDAASVNRPGINRNGSTQFPADLLIQRGALTLSPDGARVYVAFGGAASGWLVAIDTAGAAVASAFSTTARTEEAQGGMWGSAGASVDADGYVHIATGASVDVHLKKLGVPGIFPESAHNWGQSILRLRDGAAGFSLAGTYSPFNYVQAQTADIDLASSGAVLIDLDPAQTSTPHLLLLGGMKQGNVYLLDRRNMPGSLERRPPQSDDSGSDGSLLAPHAQPQFGKRGPLNVFGPYLDHSAMNDQARSRSTAAYFRSAAGGHYAFITGSAKTGPRLDISTPPGLARVGIRSAPGKPAWLELEQLEGTHTLHNPGSPVVSSNGGRDALVWVLDTNAPRTAPLHGPRAARPVLYAFDALTFDLVWKSAPGELATTGKYNEPTVAAGLALVGTDRIQAFGLRGAPEPASFAPLFAEAPAPAPAAVPVKAGEALFAQRCAACHESAQAGIPTPQVLARLGARAIGDALRHGVMRPQATGLSEAQIESLGVYLSSRDATPQLAAPPADTAGRALYVRHCIVCHMPDGRGVPGLIPGLGASTLAGADPLDLARVVLHGPAAVLPAPKPGHATPMAPSASVLKDDEAAALLNYLQQTFGAGVAIEPAQIRQLRRRP